MPLPKPPQLDDLTTAFKALINVSNVTDLLEPVSDSGNRIFTPQGNYQIEGLNLSYWSRIVLLQRQNLIIQPDFRDNTIPAEVHVRCDFLPAEDGYEYVNKHLSAIQQAIYLEAEQKKPSLNKATVKTPLSRVQRSLNCVQTENGYFTNYSIYKTVVTNYE